MLFSGSINVSLGRCHFIFMFCGLFLSNTVTLSLLCLTNKVSFTSANAQGCFLAGEHPGTEK